MNKLLFCNESLDLTKIKNLRKRVLTTMRLFNEKQEQALPQNDSD